MKKIRVLILITAALFTVFTVSAFASESSDEAALENKGSLNEAIAEEKGEAEDIAEKNIFESLYGEIKLHSEEILSALAFIGSLFIALTYKRGLLPMLRGSLNTMSERLGEIKDGAESSAAQSGEAIKAASEKLDKASELIALLSERLGTLEKELNEGKETRKEKETMRLIMATQVDMLYDIFATSSLPVYQKEIVGEKISEMKKALGPVSADEEN